MKIFISWSGQHSRALAEALSDWLPHVIQAVKPFYSPDIEKGAKWSSEVDDALEGTRFGILCLTPDNLSSPWIHYEAGALSKTRDARIWTFLHGLTQGDVPPPLGKFQHTKAEKKDVLLLLKTINARLVDVGGEPLRERLLEENFEVFWPMLEERLSEAESKSVTPLAQEQKGESGKIRDEGAKLNEVLEVVRSQERRLHGIEEKLLTFETVERGSRRQPGASYYKNISFSIDKESVGAQTTAQDMAAEIERLEPFSKASITDFSDRYYVHIDFVEPISTSKAQALLNATSKRVNYVLKGWGGTPV